MRILMLLESKLPDIRVENEIYSLIKAGHSIELLCYGMAGSEYVSKDLIIHRRPIPKFIYRCSIGALRLPIYFNWWRRQINSITQKTSFDAIHIHDLPLAKIGYEFAVKRYRSGKRIKFILDLHENYPALLRESEHTKTILGRLIYSDRQWRQYEEKYILLADEVITICEEAADKLQWQIGNAGDGIKKIYIVQNTINLDIIPDIAFKPADRNGQLKLFYGGSITKHRGLQIVIEAMRILQQQNGHFIHFDIVGEGRYKKTLVNMVASKGVVGIQFHSQKSFGEYWEMLSESHIGIIPHLRNENNDASSPNKLFQYMYAGVMILCSDCNSLIKIMKETNCSFVYKSDDSQSLADVICDIDNFRDMLNRGKNGEKAVIDKYNWANDAKELLKIYEK